MIAAFGVIFGPLVWAAHFTLLYAVHSSSCAVAGRVGAAPGPMLPAFALLTLLALALSALPVAFPGRCATLFFPRASENERRFLSSLMRWLAGLSVVAVAANGLAVLLVPPC